ncbi:hypothetical protein AB1L42_14165 [Thalassoglobus sp. JC818]|uniref:hypothetical protein n=1 Tax=Thalassoglobus sp. JC818 TaxID=3232136 RepID=UPI00345A40BA
MREGVRLIRMFKWGFSLILVIGITGCGLGTYEERLAASSDFNSYLQRVDANLTSPIWERADLGIKMRLPLPFEAPMSPPPMITDQDGNSTYGPDDRQPPRLGVALPGIVDAWKADLPGEGGGMTEARIFVLSNHSRFRKIEGAFAEAPNEFLNDVEAALELAFNVSLPEGEANSPVDNLRYRYTVPQPQSDSLKYVSKKDFTAVRFASDQPVQAQLYELTSGDIQVAVVIVGPTSFTPRFRQRLEMALQTLQVRPGTGESAAKESGGRRGGVSGF